MTDRKLLRKPSSLSSSSRKPQAHVGGDLLVAAAAGVQLPRDVLADDLAQAALVGGVDVLVGAGDDLEGAGLPLLLNLEQTGLDLLELVLTQATGLCVCAGEGDGAEDILLVEDVVEGEGLVVLLHEGSRPPVGRKTCWLA